jgi:hypothetical protein
VGWADAGALSWRVLRAGGCTGNDDLDAGQIVADHLLEGPLHLVGEDEEGALGVVGLAVVPDQLDVIEHLLDRPVLPGLEFVLHFEEIHGVLDHEGVVVELEFWVVRDVHCQSTGWMNSVASGMSIR